MPRCLLTRLVAPALLLVALASAAMAQQERHGTLFLKSKLGSFKIMGVERRPAEGRMEISFTGTVLVNGTPKVEANGVRREFYRPDHKQQVYHGTGKLVIDGAFESIQWFGRDMSAKWTGFGIARLVGEYDNELKTGQYWYAINPNYIQEWGTTLKTITNPPNPGDIQLIPQARPDPVKGGGQ